MADSPQTKIVEIPGMGNIEFPASMSDSDISAVIQKQTKVMYDTSGQQVVVPNEELKDRMQQGYQTTPQTQFEKQSTPESALDIGNRYAGKALSAAGLPTSFSDVPNWFQHLIGQAPDSHPFYAPTVQAFKNPTQENIVGAVPLIGPQSVSMAKDVQAGDYGSALATLGGTLAPVAAAPHIAPGLRAGKAQLAEAVRTPENKLTPVTKAVSRLGAAAVGGGIGHAIGVPGVGYGAEAGGLFSGIGPAIANKILPERPPVPNFRGGAYEEALAPVQGPQTPTAAQFRMSAKMSPQAVEQAAQAQRVQQGRGITVAPEPRESFAGENEGYMPSVPRGTLEDLALAGKPGAGKQMQQLGTPLVYTSRGADIESPNLARLQEAAYGPGVPQGNPTPFGNTTRFGKPIQVASDNLGVRWATDGVNKVSIPKGVTDADLETYARPKLEEQAQIRSQLFR